GGIRVVNALDLLQDLAARGIFITPKAGKLTADAPAGVLTAVDRDLLTQLKPDLLGILETNMTPADLPDDWHSLWEERAAIMEYAGNLPRDRADALALADVLQQMRRAHEQPHDGT